jgi:hypothetical protein
LSPARFMRTEIPALLERLEEHRKKRRLGVERDPTRPPGDGRHRGS